MVSEQYGGTAALVPPYHPYSPHLTVGWNKHSGSTFWIKELDTGYQQLSEDQKRLMLRNELAAHNKQLVGSSAQEAIT